MTDIEQNTIEPAKLYEKACGKDEDSCVRVCEDDDDEENDNLSEAIATQQHELPQVQYANYSHLALKAATTTTPPSARQMTRATTLTTTTSKDKDLTAMYCDVECSELDSPQPDCERWSPVGANDDDALLLSPSSEMLSPESELELLSTGSGYEKGDMLCAEGGGGAIESSARLRNMEEEQEMLTSSLMALTSHFAHVQLRVRQIVEAPTHERDQLLKDLEEFAFRGIPEPLSPGGGPMTPMADDGSGVGSEEALQQRQFELIEHLKAQLSELEKFAYESGAPVLPQHILVEKQKIIIDELKSKLNLQVDERDLPELSTEELKCQVDQAIGEFVGPLKMKEQLVAQLKTQITDLERFIAYLQCDSDDPKMKVKTLTGAGEKFAEAYNSYAAKKKNKAITASKDMNNDVNNVTNAGVDDVDGGSVNTAQPKNQSQSKASRPIRQTATQPRKHQKNSPNHQKTDRRQEEDRLKTRPTESLHSKAHGLMDKASLLMQMFASLHFGATAQEHFQKNTLKKTSKGDHWGDLRAQLEVDIQEVAALAATLNFDREKLANVQRCLRAKSKVLAVAGTPNDECVSTRDDDDGKNDVDASQSIGSISLESHGVLTTVAPKRTLRRSGGRYMTAAYQLSSDSDEDAYNVGWDVATALNRRAARTYGDSMYTICKELTTAVRKNFAMTLLRLMQHGLRVGAGEQSSAATSLMVPFMRCLHPAPVFAAEHHQRQTGGSFFFGGIPSTYGANDDFQEDSDGVSGNGAAGRPMHGWELILEYYYLKHGDEYNNTPARKLSESFKLNIRDAEAATPKQQLLSAVGQIIAMHRPYKRSLNAHFKAFVCAALNAQQLVEWLNLIYSCSELIDTYYLPNSYAVHTGFRDALRSIEPLSKHDFELPVDLAIRHFRNI